MSPISAKGYPSRLTGLYVHRLECESTTPLSNVNDAAFYRLKADVCYLHEHGGTGGKVSLYGVMMSAQTNKLLQELMQSIEQDALDALFDTGKEKKDDKEGSDEEESEAARFINSVINSYPPDKVYNYPSTDGEE